MRIAKIARRLNVVLLALSLPYGASAYAASASQSAFPEDQQRGEKKFHDEHHEQRMLRHLKEAAAYFNIPTEGKTAEQLRNEIKAMKEKDPAKWQAFEAHVKARRFERLKEFAAHEGISVEGKTEEQLRKELSDLCESKGKLKSDNKKGTK